MTPQQRKQKTKKQERSRKAFGESRRYKERVRRPARLIGGSYVRMSAGPDCLGELTDKGWRTAINAAQGRMVLDPEGR